MRRSLLLFCTAALALAQSPSAPGAPNASISGVVVDSVNGKPLAGYNVSIDVNVTWVGNTVLQSSRSKERVSVTDEQGRYRLDDLPPGPYRIDARNAKGGFGMFDVTRHIQLAGQDIEHVDFKIQLPGSLAGTVFDENHEPVVGVRVFLVSREYYSGVLGYFLKEMAFTDDRGQYRLNRVEAGRSYLAMVDGAEIRLPAWSNAPLNPLLRRRAIVPTFYPNSPNPEGGDRIVLSPGEKREGVDIEVRKSPSYCVEGITASLAGPASLMFNIEPAQPAFGMSSTGGLFAATPGGRTGADGRFRICGLPPGQYRLSSADRYNGPSINRALLPFEITDRDLKSLNVIVSTGLKMSGEVAWYDSAPDKPIDAKVDITPEPLRRSPVANEHIGLFARSEIPGTFTLEGLLPSEYALRIFVNSPGVYIKDVTYAGQSTLYQPLAVGSTTGDAGLRVLLAHDGATLNARVADGDGNPLPDIHVIVFPAEVSSPAMLQAALTSGDTDQTGSYSSQPLRPGKYLVVATTGRIDATPESIDHLWRSRDRFQEAELPPNGSVQLSLAPQPLGQ
jgi:hypothetical protein